MVDQAKVFVPGSIGNVGPGFDVLGLAVEGLGDRVTVELTSGASVVAHVLGRDADAVPREPGANCAVVAALSLLRRIGDQRGVRLSLERALPLAGGLGASAAASVGGALAAMYATGQTVAMEVLLAAALDGEESVAGRHLDNVAPSLLGGLTVSRGVDPPDAVRLPIQGEWWLALASPALRLATKNARGVLPSLIAQKDFVTQMANTAGLLVAFATGDHSLARRSLVDVYAEPRRASLISSFLLVKAAALAAGALGCSISGAGPTVFALCEGESTARRAAECMQEAFRPTAATTHVGRIAQSGAHRL